MNVAALPVDGHILNILRTHAELSAFDAAHIDLPFDGQLDPLTRRSQRWEELIDFLGIYAEDEEFARDFDRRRAHRSGFLAESAQASAEIEQQLQEHRFTDGGSVPPASHEPTEADAQVRRTMVLADRLRARVAHLPLSGWDVHETSVKAMIGAPDTFVARAVINELCNTLGLKFRTRLRSDGRLRIDASGVIDGTDVSFWDLADANEPAADPSWVLVPGARIETASPDANSAHRIERAFQVALNLQKQTSGTRCWWDVDEGRVQAMLRDGHIAASRADLTDIASRFGLDYDDQPRPESGAHARHLRAHGTLDGVKVEFWVINDEPARAEGEADEQFAKAVEIFEAEAEYFAEVAAQDADCAAGDDQAAAAETGLGVDL